MFLQALFHFLSFFFIREQTITSIFIHSGDNVPGDFAPEGGVVADVLLPQQDAGINLPATLFSRIAGRTNVGVYFALYSRTVLFPTNEMRRNISGEETVPEVGSRVFAATVGPGLNFTNLEEPVTIVLRLTSQEGTVSCTLRQIAFLSIAVVTSVFIIIFTVHT